jgi:hypothetical protein
MAHLCNTFDALRVDPQPGDVEKRKAKKLSRAAEHRQRQESAPFFAVDVRGRTAVLVDEQGAEIASLPFESEEELCSEEFRQFLFSVVEVVTSKASTTAAEAMTENGHFMSEALEGSRQQDTALGEELDEFLLTWQESEGVSGVSTEEDASLALALLLQEQEEQAQREFEEEQQLQQQLEQQQQLEAPSWNCLPEKRHLGLGKHVSIPSQSFASSEEFPALPRSRSTSNTKVYRESHTSSWQRTPLSIQMPRQRSMGVGATSGHDSSAASSRDRAAKPDTNGFDATFDKEHRIGGAAGQSGLSSSVVSPKTMAALARCHGDDYPLELLGYRALTDDLADFKNILDRKDVARKQATLQWAAATADQKIDKESICSAGGGNAVAQRSDKGPPTVEAMRQMMDAAASSKKGVSRSASNSSAEIFEPPDVTQPSSSLQLGHARTRRDAADNERFEDVQASRQREYCRKSIRKLVADMRGAGWHPLKGRGGGHYVYERHVPLPHGPPMKQLLVLPCTPSDVRSIDIVHARLHRFDRDAEDAKRMN